MGVIATHKARAACKERKAAKEKADAEKAKAVAAGTAQPEEVDPYAEPVEEEVCTEPEDWECTPNNLKVCDEKKTEIEALLADSAGLAEKLKDFDAKMAELDATFDKNIDALMKKVELGSQDLRKARHDVWLEVKASRVGILQSVQCASKQGCLAPVPAPKAEEKKESRDDL